MASNTAISWTDHSINFWTGCKKVSEGCKFCYMYRDKERYGKDPTEVVRVNQKTINKVLKEAKPGDKIFTCSWSDFFIEEADDWRGDAWKIIKSRPDLIWQILTKRPERINQCLPKDWGEGYPNVWLGVSVENDSNTGRIAILHTVMAKTKFISAEPLIGYVELSFPNSLFGIDWVIVGGESGNDNGKYTYRPCKEAWIDTIITECSILHIPIWVKQMGTYLAKEMGLKDRHGADINEWPEHLRIQQFPKP